jgi:uncharacterized phage protein (TIGR01671 family)
MREIKYRAWNKKLEFMEDVMSLDFEEGIVTWNDSGSSNHKWEDCILMQYTGLRDKNDKEIYEGDIVQALYGEQDQPLNHLSKILGKVTWHRFGFYFEFGIGILNNYKSLNDVDGLKEICWREEYPRIGDAFFRIKDIKVIGNVYANPELLV